MMKKLIFWVLFSLGCATPQQKANTVVIMSKSVDAEPTFITEHKVKVFTNGIPITRDQFELATNLFVLGLALHGIDYTISLKAIENTSIEWTTNPIAVTGYPRGVSGVKVGSEITIKWTGKISTSSLYHEWLHGVLFLLVKTSDPDHTSLWWETLLPALQQIATDSGI
jgi:hypothetical protein